MGSHFMQQVAEQFGLKSDEAKIYTPAERETLYAACYGFYEIGNYAEAADLFTHLSLSDPFDARFWKGLASSRQMEQKYREALHAWCMVALLVERDPWPHFHAAECLLSLEEKDEALLALQSAEEKLPENEVNLRAKIELLKQVHHHDKS